MKYFLYVFIICSSAANSMTLSASRALTKRPFIIFQETHIAPEVAYNLQRKQIGQRILRSLASSKFNWRVGIENPYASPGGDFIREFNNKYVGMGLITDDFDQRRDSDKNKFVAIESRNILTIIKILIDLHARLLAADSRSRFSISEDIVEARKYIGDLSIHDLGLFFLEEIGSVHDALGEEEKAIGLFLRAFTKHVKNQFLSFQDTILSFGFSEEDLHVPILELFSNPHRKNKDLIKLLFSDKLDGEVFNAVNYAMALGFYAKCSKNEAFMVIGNEHLEKLGDFISIMKQCKFEKISFNSPEDWQTLDNWINDYRE